MARNGNGNTVVEMLRRMLRHKPFKPFTVTLTDGDRVGIVHPENVIVYNEDLILGVDAQGKGFMFCAEHFVSIRSGADRQRRRGA
jgi:hypothetical protein